jgi:hypothetical protein
MVDDKISLLSGHSETSRRDHFSLICLFIYLFMLLGLELKAYTLSHSISNFFMEGFFQDRIS